MLWSCMPLRVMGGAVGMSNRGVVCRFGGGVAHLSVGTTSSNHVQNIYKFIHVVCVISTKYSST